MPYPSEQILNFLVYHFNFKKTVNWRLFFQVAKKNWIKLAAPFKKICLWIIWKNSWCDRICSQDRIFYMNMMQQQLNSSTHLFTTCTMSSKSFLRFLYPSIFINFISIRPQKFEKISQYFNTTFISPDKTRMAKCLLGSSKNDIFFNCKMFNREEEFSVLSSKNKMADVK